MLATPLAAKLGGQLNMTPAHLPHRVSQCLLGDITLEVASGGIPGHSVVILLHGFPDLWQGWHLQMAVLVAEGFYVLASKLRGYGKSSKPSNLAAYDIERLAEDVLKLADLKGITRFFVVGHDWGGLIGWRLASLAPARVIGLIALSAPHPGAFKEFVRRSPSQMLRSWYVAMFLISTLPEAVLAARRNSALFLGMKATTKRGVFDESDLQYLRQGWSQPGALTAMLNFYRAFVRPSRPASMS